MLQEVSWGMVYGEMLGYGFPVLFQIPCLETDPGEICGQTWKGCTHRFLLQCGFIKIQCWKEAVIRRGAGCVSFGEPGLAMGHHPWVKNDSADTVWGYYRHSAGDAGDATERNRGSKPPKVSWKRLRTDTDLPWTCFHFLLCGFHEQGQGDERGLLLRPSDGKPPVNLLASGFLHQRSRKISEVNCDHNLLSSWQHG